jgi:hypothetical protein
MILPLLWILIKHSSNTCHAQPISLSQPMKSTTAKHFLQVGWKQHRWSYTCAQLITSLSNPKTKTHAM